MKVVILAGGFGTRLSEETGIKPKPMVEIGDHPILWHIMKIFSSYGLNDFVICCGYKGHVIKRYFSDYAQMQSDLRVDLGANRVEVISNDSEPWRITLIDTGEKTMTGGRLKRVRSHLDDETFLFTYGDGVSNVPVDQLISHHRNERVLATLTAVQPEGRFGVFVLEPGQTRIAQFREKPRGGREDAWINGGFFVLEPEVLDYIEGDHTVWERDPMERLAREGQLAAYRHAGFWHAMDTLRDKNVLHEMWESGQAPWKVW